MEVEFIDVQDESYYPTKALKTNDNYRIIDDSEVEGYCIKLVGHGWFNKETKVFSKDLNCDLSVFYFKTFEDAAQALINHLGLSEKKECTCDIMLLMREGCTCGAL